MIFRLNPLPLLCCALLLISTTHTTLPTNLQQKIKNMQTAVNEAALIKQKIKLLQSKIRQLERQLQSCKDTRIVHKYQINQQLKQQLQEKKKKLNKCNNDFLILEEQTKKINLCNTKVQQLQKQIKYIKQYKLTQPDKKINQQEYQTTIKKLQQKITLLENEVDIHKEYNKTIKNIKQQIISSLNNLLEKSNDSQCHQKITNCRQQRQYKVQQAEQYFINLLKTQTQTSLVNTLTYLLTDQFYQSQYSKLHLSENDIGYKKKIVDKIQFTDFYSFVLKSQEEDDLLHLYLITMLFPENKKEAQLFMKQIIQNSKQYTSEEIIQLSKEYQKAKNNKYQAKLTRIKSSAKNLWNKQKIYKFQALLKLLTFGIKSSQQSKQQLSLQPKYNISLYNRVIQQLSNTFVLTEQKDLNIQKQYLLNMLLANTSEIWYLQRKAQENGKLQLINQVKQLFNKQMTIQSKITYNEDQLYNKLIRVLAKLLQYEDQFKYSQLKLELRKQKQININISKKIKEIQKIRQHLKGKK